MVEVLKPINGKIYRLGGDEFVTLIPTSVAMNYDELYKQMNQEIKQFEDSISFSYGTVILNKENCNNTNKVEQMMKIADKKMYLMKQAFYEKTGLKKRLLVR